MKTILSSRRHHYVARVSIFLITVALIAGMVGCSGTASCGRPAYNLTIASTAGGSVTTPGEGTFSCDPGTVVNLVAEAEEGYQFVNWTGDVDEIANVEDATTTITMKDDYSITADFAVKQYNLTISSTEGGSVTTPGEGTFAYDEETDVDLVAVAEEGSQFVNWTGSASATTSTITITMDSDKSLTAHFETIPTVPEVLFSDDFSDESSGWVTYDGPEGRTIYRDGCLYVKHYTAYEGSIVSWSQRYFTDFILEVETWLVDGTDYNWHSMSCRLQDEENSYAFGISADGYYAIAKWVDGNMTYLVESTYSSYIHQGQGVTNLIHIECIGSDLSLSVNGHLLEEVTDATFTGGDIALGATALAGTFTEVAFDNIIVTKP